MAATATGRIDILHAQEPVFGCLSVDGNLDDFQLSGVSPKAKFDIRKGKLFTSSEEQNFDRALGAILYDMSGVFNITPGFAYYSEPARANAKAFGFKRFPNTDGTVLIGQKLVSSLINKTGGDVAVVWVSAHEFAHIYQFNSEYYELIKRNLPEFCLELQADFLASWFLERLIRSRPVLSSSAAEAYILSLGSSDFNIPGTHGTQEMRKRAAGNGYLYSSNNKELGIQQAARAAYDYVSVYG